jgi:multisite-specific tRNA:(cytosine-C5)-methyltransferase
MRLYPHDQDTGGFFVCVLEKAGKPLQSLGTTEPVPAPPAAESIPPVEAAAIADENGTSTLKRPAPSSPSPTIEGSESKKAKQEDATPFAPEPEIAEPVTAKPTSAPAELSEAKKTTPAPPKGKKQRRDVGFKEDPFSYVDPQHKEVQTIS